MTKCRVKKDELEVVISVTRYCIFLIIFVNLIEKKLFSILINLLHKERMSIAMKYVIA